MEKNPDFRPQTSAHATAQPWGEHAVAPYSEEAGRAWLESLSADKESSAEGDSDGTE